MAKTIYWAVKLDSISKEQLLSAFPPRHPNVYAEHMTVVFKPTPEIEEALSKRIGESVKLIVAGYSEDEKGQAVLVDSPDVERIGGLAHITISCAEGVKPVYSNELLASGANQTDKRVVLDGVIARFTPSGWETK